MNGKSHALFARARLSYCTLRFKSNHTCHALLCAVCREEYSLTEHSILQESPWRGTRLVLVIVDVFGTSRVENLNRTSRGDKD